MRPRGRGRAQGPGSGWPECRPPEWLGSIADAGPIEHFEVRCRRLVARVQVLLYSTPDVDAPHVVVHDGPEHAEYASLTRFLDAMSWHLPALLEAATV